MNITTYQFFKKIASLPFVDEVWLYGSRARGEAKKRSDIDLAIVCPNATQDGWSQILEIIENSDTLLKIDCVRLDSLKQDSLFYKEILRDRQLLHKNRGGLINTVTLQEYFKKVGDALNRLNETLSSPNLENDDNYHDAAVKRFEFSFESFWKVLKRYLEQEGVVTTTPREVLEKAYQFEWIENEKIWLEMLRDRNMTAHVYNEDQSEKVFQNIRDFYYPIMRRAYDKLAEKKLFKT